MIEQVVFQVYVTLQGLATILLMVLVLGLAAGLVAAAACLPSWYLFNRFYLGKYANKTKVKGNSNG